MVETNLKTMTSQGGETDGSGPCAVTVWAPARADIVHVLRGVVASVASVLNFDYDRINDVRLATSEVVAHLLEETPSPSTLVLRADGAGGRLDVVVARDTPADAWPPTGARRSLTSLMLRSLADSSQFETTGDGHAIRFVKY
jgi:hypothetical protein